MRRFEQIGFVHPEADRFEDNYRSVLDHEDRWPEYPSTARDFIGANHLEIVESVPHDLIDRAIEAVPQFQSEKSEVKTPPRERWFSKAMDATLLMLSLPRESNRSVAAWFKQTCLDLITEQWTKVGRSFCYIFLPRSVTITRPQRKRTIVVQLLQVAECKHYLMLSLL
jgi:hypothetical protein